jgi:hypothetical protein
MVPLFGYRRPHRQPPHSKPAPLDDHDGSLFEILAHPGNIRQENGGLLVRRHGFVGAKQHKRRRHRTLQSQQFTEVGVLVNEDKRVLPRKHQARSLNRSHAADRCHGHE